MRLLRPPSTLRSISSCAPTFWKPHFASGAPIPSSTTISAAICHSAILDRWCQCSVSYSLAQFLALVPYEIESETQLPPIHLHALDHPDQEGKFKGSLPLGLKRNERPYSDTLLSPQRSCGI